jgi:hypothetical protein
VTFVGSLRHCQEEISEVSRRRLETFVEEEEEESHYRTETFVENHLLLETFENRPCLLVTSEVQVNLPIEENPRTEILEVGKGHPGTFEKGTRDQTETFAVETNLPIATALVVEILSNIQRTREAIATAVETRRSETHPLLTKKHLPSEQELHQVQENSRATEMAPHPEKVLFVMDQESLLFVMDQESLLFVTGHHGIHRFVTDRLESLPFREVKGRGTLHSQRESPHPEKLHFREIKGTGTPHSQLESLRLQTRLVIRGENLHLETGNLIPLVVKALAIHVITWNGVDRWNHRHSLSEAEETLTEILPLGVGYNANLPLVKAEETLDQESKTIASVAHLSVPGEVLQTENQDHRICAAHFIEKAAEILPSSISLVTTLSVRVIRTTRQQTERMV